MQVNAPTFEVVMGEPAVPTEHELTVIEIPLNASVTDEETAKPVAVTVTLVAWTPLVTERGEMVHDVTVNGADAVCPPAASVATSEPDPAGAPYGILKMQVNAPTFEVVMVEPAVPTEHELTVTEIPSKASVTPEEMTNPVPVTVTLVA